MPVPKTPVDQDYGLVFGKHDIRFSRQIGYMHSEPESPSEKTAPDDKLRSRVLATNAGHHLTSLGTGYNISQLFEVPWFALLL